MNKENLSALRQAILDGDGHREVGFNMSSYITDTDNSLLNYSDMSGRECGTTACIAGWAVILMYAEELKGKAVYEWWDGALEDENGDDDTSPRLRFYNTDFSEVRQWLGLEVEQFNVLTTSEMTSPYDTDSYGDHLPSTPQRAAAVIQYLEDTGSVAWERFDNAGIDRISPPPTVDEASQRTPGGGWL
jgi:hypothetical protein